MQTDPFDQHEILTANTNLGQSGPGINGNKGSSTGGSPLDVV